MFCVCVCFFCAAVEKLNGIMLLQDRDDIFMKYAASWRLSHASDRFLTQLYLAKGL